MSTNTIVVTPIKATLTALFAVIFLLLAGTTTASLINPNEMGFGGSTRSANYDQLIDAFYASGKTATTIQTAQGSTLWVPWFSSSSQCTEAQLQRGPACNAGTIDFEHNCMVTDELSQVGIVIAMGNNQARMNEYYNTLLATKSTNGNIPSWRVYRNGNTIEACKPGINGNCDTASDATARMIISLYTASANAQFSDTTKKQQYKQLAENLAKDFVNYEIVQQCKPSTLGHGNICYWLAAGAEAKRGGTGTSDFGYTGYYPDAIIAMLQTCSNTGDQKYCAIAGNLTLNYLQAAKFDGTTFSAPPGRSFRWIDVNGIPTAQCTNTCNPVQWDNADAPRAIGICEANYYAKAIGYELPSLSNYCNIWNQKHMSDPTSAPLQYTPSGAAIRSEKSYFAQGLQALFHAGTDTTLFKAALDNSLSHYSPSTKTFDWTACYGIYHQSFPMRALGTGLGRNSASFPALKSVCTPSSEICDQKDNDCDGQVDENNVCAPVCVVSAEICDQRDNDCDGQIDEGNVCNTQNTCYSGVEKIPATCKGGTITSDSGSGCRTIICTSGSASMKILACNKAGFFEMYKQEQSGAAVSEICIGDTCISNSGYAKSGNFPLCSAPAQPTCTAVVEFCDGKDNDCDGQVDENNVCAPVCVPGVEICDQKDNDCDGQIDENNVCAPVCVPGLETCDKKDNDCDGKVDEGSVCDTQNSCYNSISAMPLRCEGGSITEDRFDGGCRVVTCASASGSNKVLACDKGTKFEVYKQTASGSTPRICFGETCIQESGFAQSGTYPICGAGTPTQPVVKSVSVSAQPESTTTVSFRCTANGFTPSSYEWQFGNGKTATTSTATTSHKYASYGSYQVQCFVRDGTTQLSASTMVTTGTVTTQPVQVCANTIRDVSVRCDGGTVTKDTTVGLCRTIICASGSNTMQIQACDKAGYFEMYKQEQSGTTVKSLCLGNTCITDNGYARSGAYPLCS